VGGVGGEGRGERGGGEGGQMGGCFSGGSGGDLVEAEGGGAPPLQAALGEEEVRC